MTETAQLNLPNSGLCDLDLFWEKVAEIGWGTVTIDYDRIKRNLLKSWSIDFTASFRERLEEVDDQLYKVLNRTIEDVSDDGFGDLRQHIIGLGRETYEAVLKDPSVAQKIVDDCAYAESFSYAIPHIPRDAGLSWEDFLKQEKERAEKYDEELDDERTLRRRYISRTQGDWAALNPEYWTLGAESLVEAFEQFQESRFCTDEIAPNVFLALDLLRQVAKGNTEVFQEKCIEYREACKAIREHMAQTRERMLAELDEYEEVASWWPQTFGGDLLKKAV